MSSTPKRNRTLFRSLALVLLLGALGCSKSGKITGTVTYDGKPVPLATLTFHPEKGQAVSTEIEDGNFTLEKVPAGPGTFTVDTERHQRDRDLLQKGPGGDDPLASLPSGGKKSGTPEIPAEMKERLASTKEKLEKLKKLQPIPKAYWDVKTSGLSYTVTSGTQEHDIQLPKK